MRFRTLFVPALLVFSGGCTHQELARTTVLTTGTVMDIEYRTVLSNLAMCSCQPAGLPSHIDLADGVVQINDRAGFGRSGGFTSFDGFGIERFGPDAQRQVTEQWGVDATTDPERLVELQDLYRVALGLPPLPPPNAIAYLRQSRRDMGQKGGDGSGGGKDDSDAEVSRSHLQLPPQPLLAPVGSLSQSTASSGGGGSTPSSSGGSSGDDGRRRVPIEVLLTDVPPPGWFHIGRKRDVPKDARYVGHHRDVYAWVTPDGVPALSKFTVTVLSVVKLKPGEGRGSSSGLAVTSQ